MESLFKRVSNLIEQVRVRVARLIARSVTTSLLKFYSGQLLQLRQHSCPRNPER